MTLCRRTVTCGFATLATLSLTGCWTEAVGEDLSRADAIDVLVEKGATRDVAECVVDRFADRFGTYDPDAEDLDADGVDETLRIMFTCRGDLPPGASECIVDAIIDIVDVEDLDGTAFVDAAEDFDADDRIQIVEAGLRCDGLTATAARCVTDAMVREFGEDTFDSERLELTEAQQLRLEGLVFDCRTTR